MAKIGRDPHALDPCLRGKRRERRFVDRHVERQHRRIAAFLQREGVDHRARQHRQLVAGHVDGREAVARDPVDARARRDGQRRRRDVHADRDPAAAQALHRKRVVDLGRLRVVDREGHRVGNRQIVLDRRNLDGGEAGALRKMLEQEAAPVELIGRVDRARRLQQIERRPPGSPRRIDDGLVFRRVLVGLEEDLVELLAHRCRAAAGRELGGPGFDLRRDQPFSLDAEEGGLHRLFRRLLEVAFAETAKVMRCAEQAEQRGGLLHRARRPAEVVVCERAESKLALGSELPSQVEVDVGGDGAGRDEQGVGLGAVEAEQGVGRLDLDALARRELDLQRAFRLAHHPAGVELAAVFVEDIHGAPIVAERRR